MGLFYNNFQKIQSSEYFKIDSLSSRLSIDMVGNVNKIKILHHHMCQLCRYIKIFNANRNLFENMLVVTDNNDIHMKFKGYIQC